MTTRSTKRRAGILITVMFAVATVVSGVGASPANASYGCNQGFHQDNAGVCIENLPGPGARFVTGNPGCWINDNGDTRCYPGA